MLVGIKRKLSYNHSFVVGAVRPLRTMQALKDLMSTTLYCDNKVCLQPSWHAHILSLQQPNVDSLEHGDFLAEDENEELYSDYLVCGLYSSQQVVDHSDSIIHVAPSEGFAPLGMFADEFCEELCFPKLFFGEKRKYQTQVKNDYQTVARWEPNQLCS